MTAPRRPSKMPPSSATIMLSKGEANVNHKQVAEYLNANPQLFFLQDKHKGYICPICGSGQGKNGTGISTKDGKHFTCWAGNCFTNETVTNIFSLKAGVTDISQANFRQVVEAAAKETGIVIDDDVQGQETFSSTSLINLRKLEKNEEKPIPMEYIKKCKENLTKTDYFAKRGISLTTLANFSVGYDEHFLAGSGKIWQAVLFFTSKSSYEARNCDSGATGSERHRKHGAGRIFNREALSSNEPVFVCESIIDALSIIEVGGQAVSAGGTSGINSLLQVIKNGEVSAPRLLLALDNDEAGQKATDKAMAELREIGYPSESVTKTIVGEHKDANEALCANREEFCVNVTKALDEAREHIEAEQATLYEEYMRTCAVDLLPIFSQEIERHTDCYSTGFAMLDNVLDGGLSAGLYTLGAVSSVGKTTFCLQVADNIAAQGQDVLVFSLEMSKFELMAKSLSRLTYLVSKRNDAVEPVTTREVLGNRYRASKSMQTAVIEAMSNYGEFAEHIFLKEGIGDLGVREIREAVKLHIRATGRQPVVVVDYLQILAPPEHRLSDKQATDKNILELKRLSRDVGIPILGISSLNRESYNSPINLAAFKESGAIEYGSDVLLGLQHNGMDYDDDETESARKQRIRDLRHENQEREFGNLPIAVQLKVLKNRNGRKGSVVFNFHPRYNFFEEVVDIRGERYNTSNVYGAKKPPRKGKSR